MTVFNDKLPYLSVRYNTCMPLPTVPKSKLPMTATCPFDRFVVFTNPRSSERHQANKKVLELIQLFPHVPIETFETATGGAAAYARLLEEHVAELGPHTLLCIAAGDGSINYLIQALLFEAVLPAEVRHTPVLPLWGGNGNDLASMLNGRVSRTTVRMIFEHANVAPVRPMHFRLTRLPCLGVHGSLC